MHAAKGRFCLVGHGLANMALQKIRLDHRPVGIPIPCVVLRTKLTPAGATDCFPAKTPDDHAALMAIFFSAFCASLLFGTVTFRTPFLKDASILS